MKIYKKISVIRLRDRTDIKVSRETGEKIQEALKDSTQSRFITITELNNRMVNSADIKEIVHEEETEYAPDPNDKALTPAQREIIKKSTAEVTKKLKEIGVISEGVVTAKKYTPTEEGKAEYLRMVGKPWKDTNEPLSTL